ncbi:P-loop NTPase [bacterium]|nr:P-loop NTPase [bacterium]
MDSHNEPHNTSHEQAGHGPGQSGNAGQKQRQFEEQQQLDERLSQIKHKVLVLSGKGGVGKSTVAANLAISLALHGKQVGLLDIDIHGPSIPRLFGLVGHTVTGTEAGLVPVLYRDNLKIMSIGFLLARTDDAVIWRGPLKYNMIKQFLKDVDWGRLDYLVVDSPPGTGDEPLSVAQLIKNPAGAVVVTTPQELSLIDVRKSIEFCRALKMPVLGVIENMSGFVCPHCGNRSDIFKSGGGQTMAESMKVPFLGKVPIEPQLVISSDDGVPFLFQHPESETARAMQAAIAPIIGLDEVPSTPEHSSIPQQKSETSIRGEQNMMQHGPSEIRVAIPVSGQKLSAHFGHCDEFFLADIDQSTRTIKQTQSLTSPPHQPGLLPPWLGEHGVKVIIAGGMGSRAKELFAEAGIQVITGAPDESPERIINDYLNEKLVLGENVCDH